MGVGLEAQSGDGDWGKGGQRISSKHNLNPLFQHAAVVRGSPLAECQRFVVGQRRPRPPDEDEEDEEPTGNQVSERGCAVGSGATC